MFSGLMITVTSWGAYNYMPPDDGFRDPYVAHTDQSLTDTNFGPRLVTATYQPSQR